MGGWTAFPSTCSDGLQKVLSLVEQCWGQVHGHVGVPLICGLPAPLYPAGHHSSDVWRGNTSQAVQVLVGFRHPVICSSGGSLPRWADILCSREDEGEGCGM